MSLFKCSLLAFSASFLLFSGCSSSKKKEAKRQVIHLNFAREIDTFDPRKTNDETSANLLNMTHEGLFRVGLDGKIGPGLAERYTISDDGKTYTFFLRDAKWSNETPITAHDFVYSWKRAISPDFVSAIKAKFFLIVGAQEAALGSGSIDAIAIKALNDKLLEVRIKKPAPYFVDLLAMWNYYPVRAGIDESNPSWSQDVSSQVFSGPFIMKRHSHHDHILLEKNQNYWDADAVHLDEIEISMVSDAHTELEMFNQGDLDWAGQPLSLGLPIDALEPLKKSGQLHSTNLSKVYFYLFNTTKPPFNNANIRKAFSYAINRQEVVDYIAGGGGKPALGFVPPMYSTLKSTLFNDGAIDLAQTCFNEGLAELGLTRETFPKIGVSVYPSPVQEKVVQTIARQWEKAFNIPIGIEKSEWTVHLGRLDSKNYDVMCINWFPDIPDPITFLDAFNHTSDNLTGWSNQKYAELLKKAGLEANPSRRQLLFSQAEALLADEMPAAPLYFNGPAYLMNENLHHVGVGNLGIIEFKWAKLSTGANAL